MTRCKIYEPYHSLQISSQKLVEFPTIFHCYRLEIIMCKECFSTKIVEVFFGVFREPDLCIIQKYVTFFFPSRKKMLKNQLFSMDPKSSLDFYRRTGLLKANRINKCDISFDQELSPECILLHLFIMEEQYFKN